ncbi:VOC family protein [Pseudoduganella sp. DS3]|uniref:VOC family protein n=1 Tax=Pseudoduganella guangdongensis TaxID=2692179 RepID=A0A6N9HD92_9BURK|nr:VOC family protein [Pseudoduganella guangdongensis]MYN01217.1 VOC family protein [Pseudoduganella guangdongensis]
MIHHLGMVVSDFVRSAALYDACLAPLGITRRVSDLDWAIYAPASGHPFIWIGSEIPSYWQSGHEAARSPIHLAFTAPDRAAVNAFYYAAIDLGAQDNGPPGPRVSEVNFYSAFILDFDGNNIEATVQES